MRRIEFTIPGDPIGAPRMTQRDRWKRRPVVLKYFAWRDKARAAAGPMPPAEQVESLSWVAYFSPPVSWSKKKQAAAIGTLHRAKPDRDNIDKAILDSLFGEDQAIAKGTIEKRWGIAERLEITIEVAEKAGQP
jgi:Holliday junction resolvase RusA-like endonuclease